MNKLKLKIFGKNNYLLGINKEGTKYFLQAGSWDCDWYWGFGYIKTYTNNKNPQKSIDIISQQHFDSLFFNNAKNGYDLFKDFFYITVLTDKEIWQLLELMKSFYIMKEYAETVYRGGTNYTANNLKDLIKNEAEYDRINKVVIPAILQEVYKLLGDDE